MHYFRGNLKTKKLFVVVIAIATRVLLPLRVQHLNSAGAVLICVAQPTAVGFRDRTGRPLSHIFISLLLFAQVGLGAMFSPFSLSLPLLLCSLSVFVPLGPVVQLKLSVTQRNPIGFHLRRATSCVHCAAVSTRNKLRFSPPHRSDYGCL